MHLEVNGQRYPVPVGEMVVGSAPESGVWLADDDVLPRHLLVRGLPDGTVAVRLGAPDAEARINGVRLGEDPTVLLHGDKVSVGHREILAVDTERAGSTRMVDAAMFAGLTPAPRSGSPVYGTRNGRLVCLTDGREYAVGERLLFGRDAASDVVVTGGDVSREHAEIRRTAEGYVLGDLSANGTWVNGERLEGERTLARGDVLRIGGDEFRFYADVPESGSPGGAPHLEGPPEGAEHRLGDTLVGIPVSELGLEMPAPKSAAPAAAPLASLLVRSGTRKGERVALRTPVAHVGRGEHNDVVLPEPSVSGSHATLQRREGVWLVSDLGSTNGTTVDGEPVDDDGSPLGPGATIRFGEVAVLFEPLDEPVGPPMARTARMPVDAERMREQLAQHEGVSGEGGAGAEHPEVVERIRPPRIVPAPTEGRGRNLLLLLGLVLIVGGVIAFLLM